MRICTIATSGVLKICSFQIAEDMTTIITCYETGADPRNIFNLTNRIWFSVAYSFIDNDTRHHSGQNVVDRNKF